MSKSRSFPLADVLSITTRRLLSRTRMDGMGALLNYMTGQDIFSEQVIPAHELLVAGGAAASVLIEQHPFLADLQPPTGLDTPDLMAWLIEIERAHGELVTVVPIAAWKARHVVASLSDVAVAATSAGNAFRAVAKATETAEAREVADHPDLAELNVRLDGYYDGSA
ncbi:hypothetical protein HY68_01555 [Streptomyces sp. AcH 505]|uniref:DUF7736 domain-containing protein n=1 Tax=Streptomyces sp. AcH 505 TaxID=352211 RepID=UPI000591FBD6|nr:hypothetical protein HY68_01555 [Streptomyces sp. AcH 505]